MATPRPRCGPPRPVEVTAHICVTGKSLSIGRSGGSRGRSDKEESHVVRIDSESNGGTPLEVRALRNAGGSGHQGDQSRRRVQSPEVCPNWRPVGRLSADGDQVSVRLPRSARAPELFKASAVRAPTRVRAERAGQG